MRKISRRIFRGKNHHQHHSGSKHSSEEDVDESGSPAMSGTGSAVAPGPNSSSHTTGTPAANTAAAGSTTAAAAAGHSAVNQSGCNSSTSSGRHLTQHHQHHNQQGMALSTCPEPVTAVSLSPADLDPLITQLKEQRDECTKLQEELHSLKSQHQSDCSLLHQSLQEERYRFEVHTRRSLSLFLLSYYSAHVIIPLNHLPVLFISLTILLLFLLCLAFETISHTAWNTED